MSKTHSTTNAANTTERCLLTIDSDHFVIAPEYAVEVMRLLGKAEPLKTWWQSGGENDFPYVLNTGRYNKDVTARVMTEAQYAQLVMNTDIAAQEEAAAKKT